VIFLYVCLALLAALTVEFSILALKVTQARRAPEKAACYYCGSEALHVSSPSGLTDWFLTYWHCIPHRCEVCFHRQYRLAAEPANDD